jgi:hypothetical protein
MASRRLHNQDAIRLRKDIPMMDDPPLPNGSIRHWSEFYVARTHHKNRDFSQGFVPVTCGGCGLKRPVRIECVRRKNYDGRCPKCRLKKYTSDVILPIGSIIHITELEGNRVPVTCVKCLEDGRPNAKRMRSRNVLSLRGYTGYCHDCGNGTRRGNEEHPSGTVIHWSERETGVPINKAKVAFTCHGCNQKSFTDTKTVLRTDWSGLCLECRLLHGAHNRKSYERELPSGSKVLNMRAPADVNKLGVKCGLCGEVNFFTKKMIRYPDFLGYCRNHKRHEIALLLQNKTQQRETTIRRGRKPGTLGFNHAAFPSEVNTFILDLWKQQQSILAITRDAVASKFQARGERISGETIRDRLRTCGITEKWPVYRESVLRKAGQI